MSTPRTARTSAREAPLHMARGMLMGAADVVPGVSGGTMALIVGIYERLIDAIRDIATGVVAVARGDRWDGLATLRRVEWGLLVPLGVGVLAAIAVGAVVIEPLLERFPMQTSAVFAGLIIGALPIPWARVRRRSTGVIAVAIVAGLAAFVFAGLTAGSVVDPGPLQIFGSAAIAICAMILPGVSGAYLLLVLGMYEPTLAAARALDVAYVATFVTGAAVGLGLFSKLLAWLLDAREQVTMAALVGLMAGSLRRLWPWQTEAGAALAPPDSRSVAVAVVLVVIAAAVVVALERFGGLRTVVADEAHGGPVADVPGGARSVE